MRSSACGAAFLAVCLLNIISADGYGSWIVFAYQAKTSLSIGSHICDQMHLDEARRSKCVKNPQTMVALRDGVHLGIKECQFQFRNERWNCSITHNGHVVFRKIMQKATREAAFFHAIISAAVAHAVTLSCSMGRLDTCGCDKRMKGNSTDERGTFAWKGCSDDISHGVAFAKDFIDASELDKSDARAIMNLQNNRAGRKAVQTFRTKKCKCHGLTGSCVVRSCWMELVDFGRTGNELRRRYDRAVKVTERQHGSGVKLRTVGRKRRKPKPKDLVYLEDSPTYCERNSEEGYLGTSGRVCSNTSTGSDGCESLCCGRGYDTTRVTEISKCGCNFHWCCEIRCNQCSTPVDVHTCKPEIKTISPSGTDVTSNNKPPINLGNGRRRKGKGRKSKKKRKRPRPSKNQQRTKRDVNFLSTKKYLGFVRADTFRYRDSRRADIFT